MSIGLILALAAISGQVVRAQSGCVFLGGGCAADEACTYYPGDAPGAGDSSATFACSDGYQYYGGTCDCYALEN